MEKIFSWKGHDYSRFPEQFALPVERYGKLQENLMWQSAGMTATEMLGLLNILEENLERLVNQEKGSLVKCGAIVQQMKMRAEMVVHTELLYHFLAILYIRDDEDPFKYSERIQLEKVSAFKEMSEGKEYDFFQVPELRRANQLLSLSETEWNEFWDQSQQEQKNLKEVMDYLTSDELFEKAKETSGSN